MSPAPKRTLCKW